MQSNLDKKKSFRVNSFEYYTRPKLLKYRKRQHQWTKIMDNFEKIDNSILRLPPVQLWSYVFSKRSGFLFLKHSVKRHFRRGFQKRQIQQRREKLGQKRRMLMGFHEYHPRHDTGLGSYIFPTALKFIKASSSPSKKIAPIDFQF